MPDRKTDVKKAYETPRHVLEDVDLTVEDKIDVLENWKSDLLQLQRASDENMPSTETSAGSTAERLTEVVEALDMLRGDHGTGS